MYSSHCNSPIVNSNKQTHIRAPLAVCEHSRAPSAVRSRAPSAERGESQAPLTLRKEHSRTEQASALACQKD